MRRLFSILTLCVMFLCILLPGCNKKEDPQKEQALNKKMYFTCLVNGNESDRYEFEADVQIFFTEDSANCQIDFPEDFPFTTGVTTEILSSDHDLPYITGKIFFYHPLTDSEFTFNIAIDLQKQYIYMALAANINLEYMVASADPDADPAKIRDHFQEFIEICYPDET